MVLLLRNVNHISKNGTMTVKNVELFFFLPAPKKTLLLEMGRNVKICPIYDIPTLTHSA